MPSKTDAERFELPPRFILYTLDQIATMLNVGLPQVKQSYIHYDRRSPGARPGDRMVARNIAPEGEKPDWRVAEKELIRYLRKRGFKIYNRTTLNS